MRICWMVVDIGNYHHARMQALALKVGIEATFLELIDRSDYPEFKKIDGLIGDYKVCTAFPGRNVSAISSEEFTGKLFSTLDRINPDVLCVNGWSERSAIAGIQWAIKRRKPTIVMSASSAFDAPRVLWRELIKRRIVRLCQAGLVGGRRQVDYMVRLGMPEDKVFMGYNTVDNLHFQRGAENARNGSEKRAQLGLPEKYFLTSVRFIKKKNLHRLLSAYAKYRNEVGETSWSLVIVGGGVLWESIVGRREELGLKQSVYLPGFKSYEELPYYYGLASAFVLPSTSEQWGLVVNEAMATGLPVLVSERCGCSPNLVDHGRNGFTFDPYDVESLAKLMLEMTSDDCDREALGQASKEIISSYSTETFAEGLVNAAKIAMKAPLSKVSIFDFWLLKALIHR